MQSLARSSDEWATAIGGYPAIVGPHLLDETGVKVGKVLDPSGCVIISDTNVAPLFSDQVTKSLLSATFEPTLITVPAGEPSKTLAQAGYICDQMVAVGLDRTSFVIGLGGGVIGDISGFVAAIYHRGIPHIQIPTTLLAMVDSSIGGKTGVNTRDGKNLIGAVHQPSLVIDDIDVLRTLPQREFNQGFAEIVKHSIIADTGMFEELKVAHASGLRPNQDASGTLALQSLIQRNIEIKSAVVARDELDRTGERAVLNFGHTVGHAIERAGDYREFLHGEALSLGIVAACTISVNRAGFSKDQRDSVVELLGAFNLPTCLPQNISRAKIFAALPFDKKFEGGKIRFVVTPAIGSARIVDNVTMEDIHEAVEQL